MTHGLPPELDDGQRRRLAEFADVMIPGGEGLPSARDVSVADALIDRVLTGNPDLFDPLVRALSTSGDAAVVLKRITAEDPPWFRSLAFAIGGAYFLAPAVRRAVGYPGNAPRPLPAAPDEADYYLSEDILAPVIARGPIYRAADDSADAPTAD